MKVASAVVCAASSAVPAVWGSGVTPAEVDLLDGVAWLASEVTGDIVRVNGETGRVDARVGLGEAMGSLDVEQSGDSVLVRVGDEVRSIDVADLDWGAAAPAAGGVVVAESVAYMVDLDGSVQSLDPVTLESLGEVELDAVPESVTVTGNRLVVALNDGTVKLVDRDEVVADVDIGGSGDRLGVTAVGDEVALLNISDGELRRLDPETGRARDAVEVDLPSGELLVPAELPSGSLWALAVRTGQLVGMDLGSGSTERIAVAEPRSELTGPVALDGHVYLVDRTAATIVDVDTKPLEVTRREPLDLEDASQVEVIAEGGKVFVNDPASELAVVIDGQEYRKVDKYSDEGVAEAPPDDLPPPSGAATPSPAQGGPTPADPVPAPGAPGPPPPQDVAPAAPANVQAVAGNQAATVSWAPGAGGGMPTAYHVAERGGGRTIDVPGGQMSVEIDGLRNGQSYVFEVWASNDAGESERVASNAVEPNDEVPGVPGNVRAESQDASARVTWAEADGRGNDIANYIVTAEPGGLTQEVRGNATSVDFAGLTNGTTYTFTVRAVNDLGNQGQPSDPSNAVMPYGPPGEIPSITVGAPEDGRASLSWEPAQNYSDTPVTYEVTVNPASGAGGPITTQDTSYQLTGLQNGVSYTVTITPSNDRGAGPASTADVRPGRAPTVPSVTAERTGDRDFRIRFSVDNGGRPVTSCSVTFQGGSAACDATSDTVNLTVGQYDTQYTFTVTVQTELGNGSNSAGGTSDGKPLTVDANADRWDGATCSWPGHEGTRPILRGTEVCTGFIAWVPNRQTVRAVCHTTGTQHQDDYLNQTTTYVRVTWNGTTGYMSVLYFDGYRDQQGVISGLRRC